VERDVHRKIRKEYKEEQEIRERIARGKIVN
jgi:hypothetical protein